MMDAGWTVTVEHFGTERQPVVIIDEFAPRPEQFVADAGFLAFAPMGEFYPGIRANVPRPLLGPLIERLRAVAAETFGASEFQIVDAFYSLVTTPPADLAPIQRMPHFDGVEHGRFALLHYLSRDERGGTAFYRHRSTGYETVDAGRLAGYRAKLGEDIAREGMPGAGYIAGDTTIFERIGRVEGRFNRAIFYASNVLHCAEIPGDMALSRDPAAGRLTVNTFLAG